jgi:hypothetical protein
MFPCNPYSPYPFDWKIYANARCGVVKHSFISLYISIKFIFNAL